jgi:DNA-binding transcriptional LysR family regulator
VDIRQLRYFIAVAQERNFSRAAEVVHIAQPPLSRQIQQLEDTLGVELLDRSKRPLVLTDAGQFFYEQARQIVAKMDQLRRQTRDVAFSRRRRFVIGCVGSTMYGGIPDLVRRMRAHWPDLDIEIREMMSTEQIVALKEGRINVGYGRVRFNDPDIKRITLREERLFVAFPLGHPKAGICGPISLSEIEGETLIAYPEKPRPSFADEVLNLLAEQNVQPGAIEEVREIQTALGLVASGAGVCIIPAASQRQRPDDVCYRMIAEKSATSPIIMSYRMNDPSGMIEDIMELIKQMYADRPSWLQLSELQLTNEYVAET